MPTSPQPRKLILTCLLLTFSLSAIFYFLLAGDSLSAAGGPLTFGLMWMPGLSAILTSPAVQPIGS